MILTLFLTKKALAIENSRLFKFMKCCDEEFWSITLSYSAGVPKVCTAANLKGHCDDLNKTEE